MSEFLDIDKRHIWHPFTQHATERDPVVVTRARAASLFDEEGNEILDLISSWWTCIHGHAHPAIVETIANQAGELEHVMFAGFTHPPAAKLAQALATALPGDLNRVFFSDNGSTAVEVALKLAYQYHRNAGDAARTEFFAFEGGYHGDTLGAMSLGRGSGFFTLFEGLMCPVHAIPYAPIWEGDEGIESREKKALQAFAKALENHGQTAAALIIEPLMQGAGGFRFCRPEFVQSLSAMAQEAGLLVIFDEVATGFGRTGALFACEKAGVVPDVICLSKGLTAGAMPMSVTVARDSVYDAFLSETFDTALAHGHSFTANPLACAVALRSLTLFDEENTLTKIAHIEARHKEQLTALAAHPRAEHPRAMGSMLAFELAGAEGHYKTADGERLRDWYLNNGLNIRPLGPTVYLMPPYCITDDELTRAYAGLTQGLDMLER
ncbi:MAG: adenosylmethionine--8-amino-7-oxononanoate transaminase [Hyphomicrobiales bacterium]|nr:adenosylmethionine--8-amino-7-oxononanoate transaminase [Hyphomicrobiales bacterium]